MFPARPCRILATVAHQTTMSTILMGKLQWSEHQHEIGISQIGIAYRAYDVEAGAV